MANQQIIGAITGNLRKDMREQTRGIRKAVRDGIKTVTYGLRDEIKNQVAKPTFKKVGLKKLVRARVFPGRGASVDSEGVVYSLAGVKRSSDFIDLIEAFDKGVTIRAQGGKWLTIPTFDAALKRLGNAGTSRAFRPGDLQLLGAKAAREAPGKSSRKSKRSAAKLFASLSASGQNNLKFVPTKKPDLASLQFVNPMTGQTFVAYWLVKQVRLRKRLDISGAERKWRPQLETEINRNLDELERRLNVTL